MIETKRQPVRAADRKRNATAPRVLAYHAPTNADSGPEVVATDAWITQNAFERSLEITEQSWRLRDYISVLSLLVVVDADGRDDFDMVSQNQRKNQRRPD